MKKISIGLLAIMVAIGGVAFTKATKSNKFACPGNLVWYQVQSGQGNSISVSVGSPILSADRAKLILTPYPDNGDLSITSADFPSHLTESQAQSAFCPTTGLYVCAVAFVDDGTPTGEFEFDASFNVIPKVSGPNVACIIKRSVQ